MPLLAFEIQADYDKVIRLREEIHKLKEEIKTVDAVNSPHQFNVLNQRLKQCIVEYNHLTEAAVQAGAKMESGLKKKIYDAQQAVNDFTEEIMKQKRIVYDTSEELKHLTSKYNELKRSGKNFSAQGMLPQLNNVRAALDEQRRALFDLTQERAKASLGVKRLREEQILLAKESGASIATLGRMKNELLSLGKGLLAGWGIEKLGSEIIRVRGQFQQADTAIQTLLGSNEKSDKLLSQVREYAKISPLEFGDITKATQMMLGFNIEAEKVPGFIKAIGDVSMGESSRFNSLTLAFSQMSATGKLMGQDLNQMINAGFNPLQVMAEKSGKSVAQLKEEMSKGAITAEMVQQAFVDATSAGGKFYNMSENAAKTINGQLSMMHDAIDSALNDIGKDSEGVIVGAISGVTKLIENYETLGRVLMGLTATYGAYRTAVALVTFAENGHTLAMTLARAQILLTQKAQALLNTTMLANPYVLAATAIAGLVSALALYKKSADEAELANERLNKSFGITQAEISSEQKKIDELFDKLRKAEVGTNEYKDVKDAILKQYGSYLEGLNNEIATLKDVEGAYKAVAAAARDAALARGREAAIASANSEYNQKYSEYIGKIYDQLIKKGFNEDDTKRMLGWIQSDMKKTGKVAEDTQRALHKYGVEFSWFGELNKAESGLSYETQKINAMFGEQGKVVENTSKKVSKLSEDYKAAERSFRNAKNWLKQIEKNKSDYTTEEYNKALQDYEAKKKAFKDVGGDPDKKKNGGGRTGTKEDIAERVKELNDKQITAQIRAAKDLEFSTREAEIKAMKDGSEKTIAQIDLNRDKELDAIERAYEDLRQKRIDEAKQLWDSDPSNNGKNFFDSDEFKHAASEDRYTDEERANRVAKRKAADAEYKRSIDDVYKKEAQALYDYLKEYGTFQQQKLAIAQEYAEKIRKAEESGNKVEVMRLKEEQKRVEGDAKANELAKGIDFSRLYDGVGTIVKSIAAETYRRVQDYKGTDEYKKSSSESKKAIADLEAKLIEKGGAGSASPFSAKTWDDLTKASERYDEALKNLQIKTEAHTAAVERQKEANEALTKDFESSEDQYRAMQEAMDSAAEAQKTAIEQEDAQSTVDQTGQEVKNASIKAAQGLQDFNTMLSQITSGTLSGFVNGVSNIIGMLTKKTDDDMNGLVGVIGEKAGGIIGAILTIIDTLGDNPTQFVEEILDKVADVLEAVISQLPQIIMKIVEGAGNIVVGLGKGILGIFGDFFGADNHEEMLERQDKYNRQLDITTNALKRFTEELSNSYGALAIQNADKAEDLVRKSMETIMKGIDSVMWDNYGGGSSDYWHANKALNWVGGDLQNAGVIEFFKKFGLNLWDEPQGKYTWNELFNNNDPMKLAEAFKEMRDSSNDLWRIITTEMGANDGALKDWLEKLIDAYEQIDESQKSLMEQITTSTETDVFDEFLEHLYDLADGSEDVMEEIGDNWQKMVNRMVVNNLVGDSFQSYLQEWYKKLADTNRKRLNNEIGDKDYRNALDDLKKEYDRYVEDGQKQIEQFRDMGIIAAVGDADKNKDQTATVSMAEKATYDQFDTYLGIATAQQIAQEQIKDSVYGMEDSIMLMNMNVEQIMSMSVEQRDIASESRDILSKSYLELQEANEHLSKIEKSVGRIESSVNKTERLMNERL